jgi:hypothetical protein
MELNSYQIIAENAYNKIETLVESVIWQRLKLYPKDDIINVINDVISKSILEYEYGNVFLKEEILKSCPFCDGEANHELTVCDDVVRCIKCGATVRANRPKRGCLIKPKNAIEMWNSRTKDNK